MEKYEKDFLIGSVCDLKGQRNEPDPAVVSVMRQMVNESARKTMRRLWWSDRLLLLAVLCIFGGALAAGTVSVGLGVLIHVFGWVLVRSAYKMKAIKPNPNVWAFGGGE